MLFIAPVVSKSLVTAGMSHSMMPGMSMAEMPMAAMDMSEMSESDMQMSHDEMADAASNQHSMPMHDMGLGMMMPGDMSGAACGYCVLLAHLPLLHMLALPMLWVSSTSSRAPPRLAAVRLVPTAFYPDSQPRAPPAFK
ncbi:DUF2946 domain-containing protein [Ewingella americana]|uniref:DUF2946 domain-containing protein n=1 Tax=Ewingella americana TaxID=41202 RepID=UPI001F4300EE|nr:DUF2946 domain-containing protein [Ewingella americana]